MKDPDGEIRTKLAIQRNALANERTFLAWLRSGLAGVVGGFALVRFVEFKNPIHQRLSYFIGILFILWGIALFFFAIKEYNKISKQLRRLNPDLLVNGFPIKIIALVLVALSFLILLLLL